MIPVSRGVAAAVSRRWPTRWRCGRGGLGTGLQSRTRGFNSRQRLVKPSNFIAAVVTAAVALSSVVACNAESASERSQATVRAAGTYSAAHLLAHVRHQRYGCAARQWEGSAAARRWKPVRFLRGVVERVTAWLHRHP